MSTALRCASFFLLAGALFAEDAAPKLDYLFFKEQVQPIFLEKRIGHARCVACHTRPNFTGGRRVVPYGRYIGPG